MTPHISAKKGEIAKTVIMPGDPLRAKFIADTFLENVKQVNTVRNMFMYTGTYKGKEVSIAASGMGGPSIGIYSYELFKFYDVDRIVRAGSAGAYDKDLALYQVLLATESYADSTAFGKIAAGIESHIWKPSENLNNKIRQVAKEKNINLHEGRVHSSDVFYAVRPLEETLKVTQAVAVEMESAALFVNAKVTGKEAACIVTVSDNLITHELTTAEERQTAFTAMIELALGVA